MNLQAVGKILGFLLLLLTGGMVIPLGISSYDFIVSNDPYTILPLQGLLAGIAGGLLFSMALLFLCRAANTNIGSAEAILLVFLSWFIGAIIAALPFYSWAHFQQSALSIKSPFTNPFNCLFETISGLTTTGASILTNIPAVPDALLFWRALVQWYGGLGIVVLFVAILPMIAGANKRLFSAEATGISKDGNTPKIQETARTLWLIYFGFTCLQVLVMMLLDPHMSLFTAVTIAFSTTATAGFSIFNESAGTLLPSVQWTLIVFMMISGVNYGLYYQLLRGRWRSFINDSEFKTYISILLIAAIIVGFAIQKTEYNLMTGDAAPHSIEQTIRDAWFQVVSIQTTTGFSNADYNTWPLVTHYTLLALMFIGGCGGSTSGGIKVSRILIAFRLFGAQLEKVYRPAVIRPLRVGNISISESLKIGILLHILAVVALAFFGAFCLLLFEGDIDGITAFSASVAAINNIGPGLSAVGATSNYAWMTDASKFLLSLLMLIGRLEVFTVMVLFTKRYWRPK